MGQYMLIPPSTGQEYGKKQTRKAWPNKYEKK